MKCFEIIKEGLPSTWECCDFCQRNITYPRNMTPEEIAKINHAFFYVSSGEMCGGCREIFFLNVQFMQQKEAEEQKKATPPANPDKPVVIVHETPAEPSDLSRLVSLQNDRLRALQSNIDAMRLREAGHLVQLQNGSDFLTVVLFEGRPEDPDMQQQFANRCCEWINAAREAIHLSPEGYSVKKLLNAEDTNQKNKRYQREAKRKRFKTQYDAILLEREKNNPAGVLKNKRN